MKKKVYKFSLFNSWLEFIDNLSTFILGAEGINHYLLKMIIFETSELLFETLQLIIDNRTYSFHY